MLWSVIAGRRGYGLDFYTPYRPRSSVNVVARLTGVFISGFPSIPTGLNFIITIHAFRAPGLSWCRLPLFLWSLYATSIIPLLATPVLAITLAPALRVSCSQLGIFDRPRRRSGFVSAFLLVLLASGRLHHDFARMGVVSRGDLGIFPHRPTSATSSIAYSSLALRSSRLWSGGITCSWRGTRYWPISCSRSSRFFVSVPSA